MLPSDDLIELMDRKIHRLEDVVQRLMTKLRDADTALAEIGRGEGYWGVVARKAQNKIRPINI